MATLGHRRLAIFDLSRAGYQPMTTADRSLGVVFNGAIYNWPELRRSLEHKGFRFLSETDTEVLLHGYREWGIDGLVTRLRGMFSFGLWDDPRQRLFLVRDRMGVKPLVYLERHDSIVFASTPGALYEAGIVDALSDQAVGEFMEFGFVPERSCVYKGVRKLPPSTILEWSPTDTITRRYWSMPAPHLTDARTFDELVDEAESRIVEAVSIRQFADVPVAALLSGGVDSALVCCALAQVGANVTAYTVGTPGHAGDEATSAVDTAKTLGLEHRVITMTDRESAQLPDLIAAYSEPFACSSALGMLALSRAIRPHATVVLTGDGGDDAFLGYRRHRYLWLAQSVARSLPGPTLRAGRAILGWPPIADRFGRTGRFLSVASGGLAAYHSLEPGLPSARQNGWLGPRLSELTIHERGLPQTNERARQSLVDFLEYHRGEKLVAEYLTKVDGSTMFHGLEARSPFMDQRVWEFAGGISAATHLRAGRLKAVLRAVAERRLGARVAGGRKRGFSIPVESWLGGRWRHDLEMALRDSRLQREGYVRVAPILRQLNDIGKGTRVPTRFWYYFVLEKWMRRWLR